MIKMIAELMGAFLFIDGAEAVFNQFPSQGLYPDRRCHYYVVGVTIGTISHFEIR
jgi:hypothetical protein